MKKKKVLKITPVLITLNLLVLFAIVGFYSFRLVKYYKLQNVNKGKSTILLVDELKNKRSYLDDTKGLVYNEEEDTYRYKGEVDDNYLFYSGLTYRIIGIDKDGNVRAISEDNVTLMYPGFDNGYKESYINKWLNLSEEKNSGVFEDTLVNSQSLLSNSYYCFDSASDMENITCEENTNDYKITLLSLYDYRAAGGKSSFLNNGNMFNLGTLNEENFSYYVTEEGDIALQQKQNKAVLIRPVITISASADLVSGNGSKNKPYRIEKHKINELSDAYVGSYVSIDNEVYRVVKSLEDKVLVVKHSVLMNGEEELKKNFGGSTNVFTTKEGIGKYLNKTFLESLSIKDSAVNGEFGIGLLNLDSYDYGLLKSQSVKAKVGLLTMGDMFINDNYNVLTTFRGIEDENIVYVINEDGYYFGDTVSGKYNVCPAIYLKDDIEISEGSGTLEEPYVIGVNSEEGE